MLKSALYNLRCLLSVSKTNLINITIHCNFLKRTKYKKSENPYTALYSNLPEDLLLNSRFD